MDDADALENAARMNEFVEPLVPVHPDDPAAETGMTMRRARVIAACGLAALLWGCSSSSHRSSSTTTAAGSPDGRVEATAACRTWASAGSEPEPSAAADQRVQADAARQAVAAAVISPQWEALAKAMTEENGMPLTGNTPAQEATGAADLAIVQAQCQALIVLPTSSTTSTPSTSRTPVSGKEVSLLAGSPLTMTGSGCGPGALVQVVIEGTNHAEDNLATVPADRSGRFSITVDVPDIGTPTADVSAGCVGPTPADWVQIDTLVHYLSTSTTT